MILSDTHYLASSLTDPQRDYDAAKTVNDGRTLTYNIRLFDEALDRARTLRPEYLVLTGDLTFNGEKASHRELAVKLEELAKDGIQPLVIPGNHDVYNIRAADLSSLPYQSTSYVSADDFKNIYAACGYAKAQSVAPDSLSYIYETEAGEWLLMLDTTLSKYNLEDDYVYASGYFDSIDWLEENLRYAASHGIRCISFSHHNLVNHNPLYTKLYDIGNHAQLLNLFANYGVACNFSGHLHIQDTQVEQGIYDVASASLLDYGNRYGFFETNKEIGKYESRPLDFSLDQNRTYSDYSYDLFYTRGYEKFYAGYPQVEIESDREELAAFTAEVNCHYFNGEIKKYYRRLLKSRGYKIALQSIDNFEDGYLNTMLKYGNHECQRLTLHY